MIQGIWQCHTCVNDGRTIPDEVREKLRLSLTENIYKTTAGEQVLFEGEYWVNEQANPHEIDIRANDGPFAGQSALGIFERSGNLLKLAYVMPGKPRPLDFASVAGSGIANTTWQLSS